jgi:adenylate cyclase
MGAKRTRRLRTALLLMLVCIPVALGYELAESAVNTGHARVSVVGVFMGIVFAMPLALLEESGFDQRMRRLPFSAAIVLKSLTYVSSLFVVFMLSGLLVGALQGLQAGDLAAAILRPARWGQVIGSLQGMEVTRVWVALAQPALYAQTAAGFLLYLIIVFFRQLDRLLGPGVLVRYILGRYHRPRLEVRIFMFLDLHASTVLGETLDGASYYGLLNEFFRDISGPVLDSGGEIYEYVGDEAVITWTEVRGIADANCVQVLFDIDAVIERKKQSYLDRFGVVPEYKAGVHMGEVVIAEIGDLKRALVFNGDVLNTGARIQAECGPLGKRLLTSATLFERLTLPEGRTAERVGPRALKGKAGPVELVAIG